MLQANIIQCRVARRTVERLKEDMMPIILLGVELSVNFIVWAAHSVVYK